MEGAVSEARNTPLTPADLPPRAQLEVAVGAAIRHALKLNETHGPELERRGREAAELAHDLVGLPDAKARQRIRRGRGRFYSPRLVLELTANSGRAAPSDAAEGLRLAGLAVEVLRRIPDSVRREYAPRFWFDLWAGIEAERGNAFRILGKRKGAFQAFRKAFELLRAGTGDQTVEARVASLAGSHFWTRNRIRAASVAFNRAARIYTELGNEGQLGTVQLAQAALLDERGLLPEAISLQREALARLDEGAEPLTVLAAHANLAEMMQEAGLPIDALSVLADSQALAEDLPQTAPALGTWHWIRGRCRIASGTLDGERDLLAAWRILEPTEDTYRLGLVGADLCRNYLNSCNLAELEHWVGPTVRALERHAPTPDIAQRLAKLAESVQRLKMDAAQVGQVLELVSETMSPRRGGRTERAG